MKTGTTPPRYTPPTLIIAATLLSLGCSGGFQSGTSVQQSKGDKASSFTTNTQGGIESTPYLFFLIDFSASSEKFRSGFFNESSALIGSSSSTQLGVIAFGQKSYELYFGQLPTKREYVKLVRNWIEQPSASTTGTDLSSPFLKVQELMNQQEIKPLSIYLFTDAGTELMSSDRRSAFKRILTNLKKRYGLSSVSIKGVRANIDDNYRQDIRDLFSGTGVKPALD